MDILSINLISIVGLFNDQIKNLILTEYRMVKFEQSYQQVCKDIQVSALYKK
jgi:hypothetical protein